MTSNTTNRWSDRENTCRSSSSLDEGKERQWGAGITYVPILDKSFKVVYSAPL